nr:RICIN domain-containing protein [Actinoplanes polyasparticus]
MKNPATGKCLAVPEEAHEGGEQLYVMACNKNLKSQRWRFPVE